MSKLEKQPSSTPASLRAAEQISQLIFSGELIADSNHLESELATRLGISRTPVREATLMLQARGLLEVQPRKGVRICAISVVDMENVLIVMTELECLAARLAAEAGLAESRLAPIDHSIQTMIDTANSDDLAAWTAADELYHIQLVELSDNKPILSIIKPLHDQIRRARNVILNLNPIPVDSNHHHRRVYNAILSGDATTADQAHREHRMSCRQALIETLQRSGLKRI